MAGKSGTGLKKETAGALSALLGPTLIVPLIFLLIEKDKFVKFYSMQSLLTFIILIAISLLFLPTLLSGLAFITGVVLWLVLTYKAWMGEEWEIPYIGEMSRKLLRKWKL